MIIKKTLLIWFIAGFCISMTTYGAGDPNGKPFQQLQQDVEELQQQVQDGQQQVTGLHERIDAEHQHHLDGDAQLQGEINAEILNRESGDALLQNAIDAEAAARAAGDAQLQSEIDAEVSNRAAADNNLQYQINEIQSSLNQLSSGVVKAWAFIDRAGNIVECSGCTFSDRFGTGKYQVQFDFGSVGHFKVCVQIGKGFCDAYDFAPNHPESPVYVETHGIEDTELKNRPFKLLIY